MKKRKKNKDTRPFSEKHPRWNFLFGLLLLFGMIAGAITIIYYVIKISSQMIHSFVEWVSTIASTLDAVVIVALITGAVSIVGVIISSIVAKSLDYRKARREYLAQKREEPYGQFVDMVYKIQQNGKEGFNYSSKQMRADILNFSKEMTLWGSPNVVKKWIEFRENSNNPDKAKENLFVMEEIMNEMRKDLGLKKVKKGNLLGFFINDIKQSMKEMKNK